jgi:methionine synthase II (cobalamin-independent)
VVGEIARGPLEYARLWKVAQRQTRKPVKFGAISAQMLATGLNNLHYRGRRELIVALSELMNAELNELAADNGGDELESFAKGIGPGKKIAIGVISHRTLQVERPEAVANLIRRALKVIPPERLIVSTDCGFGRQGMSRLHAFYGMVARTRGTNIVRRELGLGEAEILAADPKGSLLT